MGRRWKSWTGLAETAAVRVVGRLTQRRDAPDAATYLGHGKVLELTAWPPPKTPTW